MTKRLEPVMAAKRSALLDWARAAAIAMVVLRHGYVAQTDALINVSQWPPLLENLALNGWLGVDLFFVLSGFLLSRQLLIRAQSQGTNQFLVDFWRRRAYRILPCYLIVLIPIWAVREYGGDVNSATGHLQLLIHLLFLQDYFGSNLLITTWSLATEEKFYLLLPLLIMLSLRTSSIRSASMFAATSLLILGTRLITCLITDPSNYPDFFWQVRAPFHNALDGLLLGMAAGYLIQANPFWLSLLSRQVSRRLLFIFLLIAIALLVSINWLDLGFMSSSTVIWLASLTFSSFVLLGVAAENGGKQLVGESKIASWLAAVSYPLYLVHYLMLTPARLVALRLGQDSNTGGITFWIAYLTGSLVLAWLLHMAVEKPFLNLRDKRSRARRLPNPPGPAIPDTD